VTGRRRPEVKERTVVSLSSRVANKVFDYRDENASGARFRERRVGPLLDLIRQAHARHGTVDVLDIGGTRAYWNIVPAELLDECKVHVTMVNLPGWEQPEDSEHFSFVLGDACDLDFADRSFHVAHSNSVVEHVGDWDRMKAYAHEVRRVADAYFVQTPNFWFPVEPHCMTPLFHWLPKPLRVRLVMHFDLGNWKKQDTVDAAVSRVDSARLLDTAMFRELFGDADEFIPEKIGFLTKSLVVVRHAAD
jgi:Methyltransferase domain